MTAIVARASSAAQSPITMLVLLRHIAFIPGNEHIFFMSAIDNIPACGASAIADAIVITLAIVLEACCVGIVMPAMKLVVDTAPGMLPMSIIAVYFQPRNLLGNRILSESAPVHDYCKRR